MNNRRGENNKLHNKLQSEEKTRNFRWYSWHKQAMDSLGSVQRINQLLHPQNIGINIKNHRGPTCYCQQYNIIPVGAKNTNVNTEQLETSII